MHQRGSKERILVSVLAPVFKVLYPPLLIAPESLGAASLAVAKGLYPDEKVYEYKRLWNLGKELGVKARA